MLDKTQFDRYVRDCLSKFYDTTYLQNCPLRDILAIPLSDSEIGVQHLRKRLRTAIEGIRPPAETPFDAPEWLGYRILQAHYIHNLGEVQVCEELAISRATYYRYLKEAHAAISGILWERYVEQSPLKDTKSGEPNDEVMGGGLAQEVLRLLALSRPEWLDLATLLRDTRETVEPLAVRQGVELVFHVPDSLALVRMGAGLLTQLLVDVLANGIQNAASDQLVLRVSQRQAETVWEMGPLLPGSVESTGDTGGAFGLLRELSGALGARMDTVTDASGHSGICFVVPEAKPAQVLIIDNDEDMTRLCALYLRDSGFLPLEAHNIDEVEAILDETTPDVILLDIIMPRVGGWSYLKRLKADDRTAPIPVIVCSVLDHPHLAQALGAFRVLTKPLSRQLLLASVQAALTLSDNSV